MSAAPLVELDQVSFFYPKTDRAALLNISLTVARGEIVGVLGATGAGKTSLCLALNGIVPQFHGGRFFGAARVGGLDTVSHPIHELARQVGIVFQDPATQLVTASVENEVAFALENLCLPREEIRTRVDEALGLVGLAAFARKHPHDLSGGQQQRLALAAAIAMRPPLIVLDEPTSQLDPEGAAEIFRLIRELNARAGISFVVTGHATEELAETVHRLVVLSAGSVVATGTPELIFRDAALLAAESLRAPDVTVFFSLLGAMRLVRIPPPVTLPAGLTALTALAQPRTFTAREPDPAPPSLPVLELVGVTHTYPDGTAALRGIDLAIHRHDYVVLLGQNGAGKSTLIRHFLRLLEPTTGRVLLDGVSIADQSVGDLAQRIGYVPQNPDRHLFHATVEAEINYSLHKLPLSAAEKETRLASALAAMNLTGHRQSHPFSLAKGDRARVVIAAILVRQPEILIFDEPTTGQDDAGARAILELTRTLHARGSTIIVITHHLQLMPGYASRAVVLGSGKVLYDAPLREAYHAFDVLTATHLRPTQIATLARAANPRNRAITAVELAGCYPEEP